MARRTSSSRSTKQSKSATKSRSGRSSSKAKPVKLWQLLLLIVLICAGYLYQQGYLDPYLHRWGLDNLAAKPTPVTVGNDSGGPQVTLDKAGVYSGAWYQAYFTHPVYPDSDENHHGGVDAAIVADFASAQQSIKLAAFDFDLPSLTQALLQAKQRGVTVQMVVDDENLESAEVADAMGQLEKAGVGVTYDSRPAFMHNKIIVIDDRVLWTGSMNLTVNGVYRNDNNMIRTTVEPLVQNYVQRFSDLFAGRMGSSAPANTPNPRLELANGASIETYFSPSDGVQPHILDALRSAKQSVDVLAFSFTDDETAQELIGLHQAGVDVRLVMEKRSIQGTGSEYATLEAAGIPSYPDGNCYVAHNKVMIIDQRIVITGSYNFTGSAEKSNDENLLIINDPDLAQHYHAEFERLLNAAQNPRQCGR